MTYDNPYSLHVNLTYKHTFRGYGNWDIACDVIIGKGSGYIGGEDKTYYIHTNDSQFIDKISDMIEDDASHEEIQEEYHKTFFHRIEERLDQYIEEFANNLIQPE